MHKDLDKAGVSNSSVFVIGFIITCYFILLVIARAVFITECRVINCVTCLLVNIFCNETCIYLGLCILERSRSAHELTDTVGGSRFQFQKMYTQMALLYTSVFASFSPTPLSFSRLETRVYRLV